MSTALSEQVRRRGKGWGLRKRLGWYTAPWSAKASPFLELPGFSACWHHLSVVYAGLRTPIVCKICATSGTLQVQKKQKGVSFPSGSWTLGWQSGQNVPLIGKDAPSSCISCVILGRCLSSLSFSLLMCQMKLGVVVKVK